jgi:hypothetical protein
MFSLPNEYRKELFSSLTGGDERKRSRLTGSAGWSSSVISSQRTFMLFASGSIPRENCVLTMNQQLQRAFAVQWKVSIFNAAKLSFCITEPRINLYSHLTKIFCIRTMLLRHDREINKSNFSDVEVGLKLSVVFWTMDYHIVPLLGTTAYVPPKVDGSFQTCNVSLLGAYFVNEVDL